LYFKEISDSQVKANSQKRAAYEIPLYYFVCSMLIWEFLLSKIYPIYYYQTTKIIGI